MAGCVRILLAEDLCVGHGQCEVLAPDLFHVDEEGVAHVLLETVGPDQRPRLDLAIKRCPEGAISFEVVEES